MSIEDWGLSYSPSDCDLLAPCSLGRNGAARGRRVTGRLNWTAGTGGFTVPQHCLFGFQLHPRHCRFHIGPLAGRIVLVAGIVHCTLLSDGRRSANSYLPFAAVRLHAAQPPLAQPGAVFCRMIGAGKAVSLSYGNNFSIPEGLSEAADANRARYFFPPSQ
jgi:hypothetical protein